METQPAAVILITWTFSLTMTYQEAEKGASHSVCLRTKIDIPDWPTTDDGQYRIWVDTSGLGEDCQLRFITILPDQQGSCLKFPAYCLISGTSSICASLKIARTFQSLQVWQEGTYILGDMVADAEI